MMAENVLCQQSFRGYVLSILSLCKVKISFFAVLSAVSGLFLASFPSKTVLAALATGVFLMASGAGALNHCQEWRTDALMSRTAGRPIPGGRIKPGSALILSMFLMSSGCAILILTGNPAAPLLGFAAVFWYNGFYTWFKTCNKLAAIPGALVGAIPPAIGWMAGGGHIFDLRLAALCFFFFTWQVLHFFIHVLACGKEYENAGLPSASMIFTEGQLNRLTFQWLLAAVMATQFIVLFELIHSPWTHAAILAGSLWLALEGVSFIKRQQNGYAGLFGKTNSYMLFVLLLLILDGLFRFPGWQVF